MFKWKCPHCYENATIVDANYHKAIDIFEKMIGEKVALQSEIIECPNPKCDKFELDVTLLKVEKIASSKGAEPSWHTKCLMKKWRLIPPSEALSFPDYIPKPILQDYEEACLTKNLSPKASATLSRRCLQGMIRNFWGVTGPNLKIEIEKIEDKCDPDTWKAIDAVRKVGKFGAHMEKDINLIIDVEPKEAELLISLIEILLKDWYVNRHEREMRLKSLVEVAEKKEGQRKS